MRLHRIFWFLICFIPSGVFAELAVDPAKVEQDGFIKTRTALARKQAAQIQTQTGAATGGAPTAGPPAVTSAAQYIAAVEACEASREAAYYACAEWLSPGLAEFVASYGTVMSVASAGLGSLSDQCKGIGSLMNKANTVLGAYQVACAAAQGICNSKCGGALSKLGFTAKLSKDAAGEATIALDPIKGVSTNPLAQAARDAFSAASKTWEGDEKLLLQERITFCKQFQINTASAIIGMVSAVKGVMTAKQCEEKTSTSADGGINCNDPKNPAYNQKGCMCTRNELPAADCQNQVIGQSGKKSPTIQTGGKVTLDKDGKPVPEFSPAENGAPLAATDSGSGGGLPGAPSGSGGGASAGGGGGGAQDGFAGGGRRLNTNILGGSGGGGGGGGFGSGAGYGEDASLKAYKPGGAKDPSRTLASQLAKEVTGQGGRSNWEKVKSRYIDNSGKLLGN